MEFHQHNADVMNSHLTSLDTWVAMVTVGVLVVGDYCMSASPAGVLCVKPDKGVLYAWAIDPNFVSTV